MSGAPYELTRTLLFKLLRTLRPVDRFNVVFFEFTRRALSEQSLPATKENIEWALQIVDQEQCNGGTNLYEALETAFALPADPAYARSFILATDGYVSIESKAFRLVTNKRKEANLFTLGVGTNVNRYLIEGLAYAGAGEACVVSNQTEANQVGEQFIRTISQPLWSHIEIDWGHFEVYDVHPDPLPDLFASKPLILFGKYEGKPEGHITLKGKTAQCDEEQTIHLKDAVQTESQALRYLWARNRIKYLSDYALFYEEDTHYIQPSQARTNHQKQITDLGLKYNLLTKYTSFLATDDETRVDYEAPFAHKSNIKLKAALHCRVDELFTDYSTAEPAVKYKMHGSPIKKTKKASLEEKRSFHLTKPLLAPFVLLARLLHQCRLWLIRLFKK
jgi:Ca-activated chloride channel family protein